MRWSHRVMRESIWKSYNRDGSFGRAQVKGGHLHRVPCRVQEGDERGLVLFDYLTAVKNVTMQPHVVGGCDRSATRP
jgi:hypothetical protein